MDSAALLHELIAGLAARILNESESRQHGVGVN